MIADYLSRAVAKMTEKYKENNLKLEVFLEKCGKSDVEEMVNYIKKSV